MSLARPLCSHLALAPRAKFPGDSTRRLAAFWDAEEGSRLPANLKAISIQAYASSSSTSMISVSYEFNNVKSCFSEKDAVEQQNL